LHLAIISHGNLEQFSSFNQNLYNDKVVRFRESENKNSSRQEPPPRRRGTRRSRRSVKGRPGASIKRARSIRRTNGTPQLAIEVDKGVLVTRKPNNLNTLLQNGYRRFLLMLGLDNPKPDPQNNEVDPEPLIEELEPPQRYRPDNISSLCEATGFSTPEMKRMYRGFKSECPQGLVTEEIFNNIFNKFFPLGATDRSSYSHYVFSAMDQQENGVITFEDFAIGLSILVKGTQEDKIRWTFNLYDLNGDGVITKDEMEDIIASVYELMGKPLSEKDGNDKDIRQDDDIVSQRVNNIFEKMDLNGDGCVSFDEFLFCCLEDQQVSKSIASCTNVVI